MRDQIIFHVNGTEHRIDDDRAFMTLSNYLRYDAGATGTKVVCEEGDCGACSVLVRYSKDEVFKPVNSCIQALVQLDGAGIVTVEGLKNEGALSEVQDAMVQHQGAQCGYCTPGFVVAMSALFEQSDRVSEAVVREGLTGNLCRCTGYEPIIKAALAVDASSSRRLSERYSSLPEVDGGAKVAAGRVAFAPRTIAEAIRFKAEQPSVTVVQGGTDYGVWVNKRAYRTAAVLSLGHIAELRSEHVTADTITVGAGVTLSRLQELVREPIPELFRILSLFGAPQIRNAGTIGGNIANASPIADTLPYLFVSGAELELTGLTGTRIVPVDQFYLGYKELDLHADELISRVRIPVIRDTLRLYKVSRRRDLDISAFTAAFRLQMSGTSIDDVRVAFGGVGPVVLRLRRTEEMLRGQKVSLALLQEAGRTARSEIKPIDDVRGSARYRLQLAENIFSRFWYETFDNSAT